jgi:hypothetical protein
MAAYARRLDTELRHRFTEFFEATRGRRECPLEVRLRSRLLEATRETAALADACLAELQRQEALFYSPYKPGDRVIVEHQDKGELRTAGPYLIVDICPHKQAGFRYEVAELTKSGTMHKSRAVHPLFLRSSSVMRRSDKPVCDEAEREANYYRDCASASRLLAFERGDLTLFERVDGPLSLLRFRRKDRTSA